MFSGPFIWILSPSSISTILRFDYLNVSVSEDFGLVWLGLVWFGLGAFWGSLDLNFL